MIVTLLLVLAMHWCSLESALAVATQSGRVRDRIESSPSQDEKLIQNGNLGQDTTGCAEELDPKLLGKAEVEIYLPDRGLWLHGKG
jgi:hypothetical protein